VAEPDLHDLSCVAHLHSQYSDGTAPIPEILDAAREAGVGAVLLTDHDTLGARRDGWEGEHGGVFLFVGVEVSPSEGHYLAFGVDEEIRHRGRSPMEIAAAVRAGGGIGFAAHPFSRGGRMLVPALARRIVRPHGWAPLAEEGGLDGLEVWSVLTDAAEAWRTPVDALRWLRDPEAALAAGPPKAQLRAWDVLSARRRVPAIGGLDGHQPGIRVRGRTVSPLSHRRTFRLLRTHLLCDRPLAGDTAADRETILRALRAGAAWLACPFVADADGARLWAETGAGRTVPIGGEGEWDGAVLRLRLPRPARVTVLRDGEPVHESEADSLDLDLDRPGAHRVEARIDGRVWLLSNPVHLRAARPPGTAGQAGTAVVG
jgi:hypothetical protein